MSSHNQPLRTIRLTGALGKRFGREFRLAVRSPAEAISALCNMVEGFELFLNESKEKFGLGYAVFVGDRNVGEDQLQDLSGADEIVFAPKMIGASGTLQVILGAVLVVVGIMLIATPFAAPMIYAGTALMVSGIITMLAPQPKDPTSEDDSDKQASYAFQGPVNASAQGGPVPVFHGGPLTIGSAVISAGIIAEDQVHVPLPPGASGSGGRTGGGSPVWRSGASLTIPLQST